MGKINIFNVVKVVKDKVGGMIKNNNKEDTKNAKIEGFRNISQATNHTPLLQMYLFERLEIMG